MIHELLKTANGLGFQLIEVKPRTNPDAHWRVPGYSVHMTAGPKSESSTGGRMADFEAALQDWVQFGKLSHAPAGKSHTYSAPGIKILWNRNARTGMEDAHHHLVIYMTPEVAESHSDLHPRIRPFIKAAAKTEATPRAAKPPGKTATKTGRKGDRRLYFDQL